MAIGGIGGQPAQMLERAQKAAEEVGQNAQEFEAVLAQVQQQGQDPGAMVRSAADQRAGAVAGLQGDGIKVEGVRSSAESERLYAQAIDTARGPEGPSKLLADMEKGHARLNQILGEIENGKTYTPQQLLGMQGEMHAITMQLEISSKVVTELVSGVKQLMQQQM